MTRSLFGLLLLALIGCDPAAVDDTPSTVSLRNANAMPAHILATGESVSASTELASGATRQVTVAPGERGEERFFRLVRDGAEVEQIGCFINNGIGSGTEVQHTAEGACLSPLVTPTPRSAMRLLVLLSAALLLPLAGCDGATDDFVSVEVGLFNDSLTPTHLFYENEDFSPSNQVAPLQARTIRIDILADARSPQLFRAGRNGTVLQTVSCRPSRVSSMDEFQVVFGADGTLRCVGW